jgi:predicted transcriptional regulator
MIAKIEAGKTEPSYLKTKAIFDMLERMTRDKEPHARDLLQSQVVGVDENAPLARAAIIMKESGFSQLPVFSGKHIVGSIAEKTIMDQIVSGISPRELSSVPVSKVMTEAFPQIDERAPLSLISALLQYHSAAVVTKRGQVIGIITKADLLRVFSA